MLIKGVETLVLAGIEHLDVAGYVDVQGRIEARWYPKQVVTVVLVTEHFGGILSSKDGHELVDPDSVLFAVVLDLEIRVTVVVHVVAGLKFLIIGRTGFDVMLLQPLPNCLVVAAESLRGFSEAEFLIAVERFEDGSVAPGTRDVSRRYGRLIGFAVHHRDIAPKKRLRGRAAIRLQEHRPFGPDLGGCRHVGIERLFARSRGTDYSPET